MLTSAGFGGAPSQAAARQNQLESMAVSSAARGASCSMRTDSRVRLEERLRAQFRAGAFPAGTHLDKVVAELWERSTHAQARGVLLLVMDLNRRAWGGSERAREFYLEQQRLWVELLLEFEPDRELVESVLALFQGAVLAFLATGDEERGWRVLERFLQRSQVQESRPEATTLERIENM